MKVLITGGGGFIGGHLAKRFYNEGHEVYVVDIKYQEHIKEKFYTKFINADLRDFNICLKYTKGMDRVYHMAANMGGIGFIKEVYAEVMRDNGIIDINMLEACRINKVPRMLYASSACAYPVYKQEKDPNVMLKEEDIWPYDPEKAYGFEKLWMEQLCEAYYRDFGVETRIARFHNIYGPEGTWKGGREKAPAALCRKVASARNGDIIEVWGTGKQIRSFCYIDDCIDAFVLLMESDIRDPINIGTEDALTIDELAKLIIRISGKRLKIKHNPTKPQGVTFRNADITKIKRELKWEPKVSLKEGLKKTYTWIEEEIEND